MFRKLAAAFLALAFAACNAFASAADVEELSKTSAAFQQADRELNAAWKHVPRNSPLVEDQRTWIKSGRDAAAQAYMQSGMGKEQAYVKATSDRTEFLLKSTGKPKSAAQATSTQATSAQTPSARGDMPFGEETPPAPQA
ncbi:MAG: DUF1311 domain-containing protein, partial [Desulfovibrionaceae bacterium]|nr:DUF1311 domain-containing protein [Desulfovibrionaceae bacterium]